MNTQPALGGPVSTALEADLRASVRRRGVRLWLDPDDHYSEFVDRLKTAKLPYEVRAFRGSYLELMLALERVGSGVDAGRLVVHLPGHTEESIRDTPLLELYAAGARYRKKLETLVADAASGRVQPERINAFIGSTSDLSLSAADDWLGGALEGRDDQEEEALRRLGLTGVVEDLLSGGRIAAGVNHAGHDAEATATLWACLDAWTGLHDTWRTQCLGRGTLRADDVAFAVCSWALCVEYTDDLNRRPVSPLLGSVASLPRGVVEACHDLAVHLRARHPEFYRRAADETEALLDDEVTQANAADLGKIDTFRFEEDKVLSAAVAALMKGGWRAAADWATARVDGGSFWVAHEPSRQSAWQLVSQAAALGLAIDNAGNTLRAEGGLHTAIEHYTKAGAAVDRAHRELEQRRVALLYPQLPNFTELRACLDGMRRTWAEWADAWAQDFNAACHEHGFLPDDSLQQRTLFEQVVQPLTRQAGVTAYFLVDALRYEMAEALFRRLEHTPASTVRLSARLAELPTVTAVGMNALAPVCDGGKLKPSFAKGKLTGFSTGSFKVGSPATRQKAMHARIGGKSCPWLELEDVVGRSGESLRRSLSSAKLVVIHSLEIDEAGETGAGPAVFQIVLRKLRAAWSQLREAGVRKFVITSDHGFLLLDDRAMVPKPHGRLIDPKRRYVFSAVAAEHPGEARVAVSSLGYLGADERHAQLMFPANTATFDVGKRSAAFVHGGNSLQERVIPVLTIEHRAPAGSNTQTYRLEVTAGQRTAGQHTAGMHSVKARIESTAQGALGFAAPVEIELSLDVFGTPAVRLELCQIRGAARMADGSIFAQVERPFEVLFRLTGRTDERVQVALQHSGSAVEVETSVLDTHFAVTAMPSASSQSPSPSASGQAPKAKASQAWLQSLPEGGVRQLFEHLAVHGAVTETEATKMLGSARKVRRFSNRFEEHAAKAPFAVRIDSIAGVKRYVREGSDS